MLALQRCQQPLYAFGPVPGADSDGHKRQRFAGILWSEFFQDGGRQDSVGGFER